MSRAGYSDEGDYWSLICWRGAVESAILGKRGQKFLRESREALDAMPVKELHTWDLQTKDGKACSLGVVGKARGIDMVGWDPEDHDKLSATFDIAGALVRELEWINDEYPYTPCISDPQKRAEVEDKMSTRRWHLMRKWVDDQIPKETA